MGGKGMSDDDPLGFESRAIHAGQDPDPTTGAVMPPITTASTFEQDAPGQHRGYEYARTGNPTRATLESNLASLEGGSHCRAFASGMAAIDAVVHLLEPDDHVVVNRDVYGGTHRLFTGVYEDFGIDFSFVDMQDPAAVEAAVTERTELLWVETPTNPLLRIVDIDAIADIADAADAYCAVDNTFATPYLQRPLEHGADLVVHSLTKYLGGHSDVVGGAVIVNDTDLDSELGFYQNSIGATPDPFGCFLVLRGTKTLPVRMDRHCENARELAEWLATRDHVETVHYPGLPSHHGHDVAARQMTEFGGMVSLVLDAPIDVAEDVGTETEVFTLAESLGGVESLIEQPATMTHAAVPREERMAGGVEDGLLRLSVGLESIDDLQRDLDQAIDAAIQ